MVSFKRLYMMTALMAFLTAPLVLSLTVGLIGGLIGSFLYCITFILLALIYVVISETLLGSSVRSTWVLRVIAVLDALKLLSTLIAAISDTLLIILVIFYFVINILQFILYIVLLVYLQNVNFPHIKFLKLHCALRIFGMALLGNLGTPFHVAAQIALGIMLLRYARQAHPPEQLFDDVPYKTPVDLHPNDQRNELEMRRISL